MEEIYGSIRLQITHLMLFLFHKNEQPSFLLSPYTFLSTSGLYYAHHTIWSNRCQLILTHNYAITSCRLCERPVQAQQDFGIFRSNKHICAWMFDKFPILCQGIEFCSKIKFILKPLWRTSCNVTIHHICFHTLQLVCSAS